jgi:spore coat-associated protein S
LKHILYAVSHLRQKGILIPEIIKTKTGQDYMNIDGICYVLSNAINGKNPSYDSQLELAKIVKELGKFHNASTGFSPAPDSKPKIHLGTWIEDYDQQIEDMNSFYLKEQSYDSRDVVGEVIIKEFPYFYNRAKKAIDGLKENEYKEWVEKTDKNGCLCHQDFAAGNLILDDSGRMYILDTDSLTIDIPARDIRKLLNKIMKKAGKWDFDLTKKILNYYQSVNPLTPSEWKVVRLDLMFPHLFIGAMNKYYYKRDKEWSTAKYLERIKEMASFEKTITPVLDKFDELIN